MEHAKNIGRIRFLRLSFLVMFLVWWLNACAGDDPDNTNVLSGSSQQALLFVSDGPVFDFGLQIIGNSVGHSFTITNVGTAPATSIEATFAVSAYSYSGGNFPGDGGTCGSELDMQSSCTIAVTYSPLYVGGTFQDVVRITYESQAGVNAVTASPLLKGESAAAVSH